MRFTIAAILFSGTVFGLVLFAALYGLIERDPVLAIVFGAMAGFAAAALVMTLIDYGNGL